MGHGKRLDKILVEFKWSHEKKNSIWRNNIKQFNTSTALQVDSKTQPQHQGISEWGQEDVDAC